MSDIRENNEITWDPEDLFSGTAWYYARYRPAHPEEAIDCLMDRFGLSDGSRILDLGCGTGQAALQMAKRVAEVVAVDPQEAMLKEGRKLADAEGLSNIRWLKGESGEIIQLSDRIGKIDLTVIARAFHWMDRGRTLKDLYTLTNAGGGVAIIADSGPRDGTMVPWKEEIDRIVKKWLGEERKAGTRGTYAHPQKRHIYYLEESDFQDIETREFSIERTWDIDGIVGYVYSTSSSSIPVLGEKKEPFEAELRDRLKELDPAELFVEQGKVHLILASKK